MVLEKTLESPLDCKEIQPVHSEDQPWDFFGRNDAEAEAPVLFGHLMRRVDSSEKTLMLGGIRGRRRSRTLGTIKDAKARRATAGSWQYNGKRGVRKSIKRRISNSKSCQLGHAVALIMMGVSYIPPYGDV